MTLRWLASPAVALVCFLAAAVTLGQVAASTGRGACRIAQSAGDKRLAGLALALLAVAVVSMPLTWQPIVAEVGKYGQGGVLGELYPATTTGTAAAGSLVLLVAAAAKQRPPLLAWLMTAGGFAVAALLVALHCGLSLPG